MNRGSSLKIGLRSFTQGFRYRTSNTVVLVRLINTLYNTRPASDRESLASTIAALLEKHRRQDPLLARVMEIHVQFLKRGAWFTRSVDTVEFRREQSGAFVRHRIGVARSLLT